MAFSPIGPEEIGVVLDANIYVRTAAVLGPGVSLNALPSPTPPFDDEDLDHTTAQALALVLGGDPSGRFVLIPSTCDHIDKMVFGGLIKPVSEKGLEWSVAEADDFLDELYDALNNVNATKPIVSYPRHANVLGDDDGRVFSAAVESGARVIVTADVPFRTHAKGLQGIAVITPRMLLERIVKSR